MVEIYTGDALEVLRGLPDEHVQCCVTSPPYWGLRDYGVPGQLGLEATPDLYISKMVKVFREVRRVLRSDGTLWLNMGDCYQGGNRGTFGDTRGGESRVQSSNLGSDTIAAPNRFPVPGIKPKDLCGIPWLLAFALRADGWYLRSDIIWAKPNPMPESVTDRPTKSHEYIFLLSKSERYYYDAEAITGEAHARGNGVNPKAAAHNNTRTERASVKSFPTEERNGIRGKNEESGDRRKVGFNERWDQMEAKRSRQNESFSAAVNEIVFSRNKRSVWTVATQPFPEAHFATFPEDLIKPCILAGCKPGEIVLDPFGGSGTTALVAQELHCRAILIELNPDYVEMAKKRLRQEVFQFGSGSEGESSQPKECPRSLTPRC